jgi:hypothetical protein
MKAHVLVAPFDRQLVREIGDHPLVLQAHDEREVSEIVSILEHIQLKAIWYKTAQALSDIDFQDQWKGVPLALHVEKVGDLLTVLRQLDFIRQLNVRIFLPVNSAENLTGVRILASLGVNCGFSFPAGRIDWEGLNDAMTYAVYSRSMHAPIEPFDFIVSHYSYKQAINWGPVFFDDPLNCLHVNEHCQIALTAKDLQQGNFVAEGRCGLDEIASNACYQSGLVAWQAHFLKPDGCAYCEAWRVCMGSFEECYRDQSEHPPCRQFFADLMAAAEFRQQPTEDKGRTVWQF